jgi:hypothetical protein
VGVRGHLCVFVCIRGYSWVLVDVCVFSCVFVFVVGNTSQIGHVLISKAIIIHKISE